MLNIKLKAPFNSYFLPKKTQIPFANNTETLIFAFVVIHGVLTKIIYETEIHI